MNCSRRRKSGSHREKILASTYADAAYMEMPAAGKL
jgi:hypothetical protein